MDYRVKPRPIGSDTTPGCYCCGGDEGLYSNISLFVSSKPDGEAVTALFDRGARLDYRYFEPLWIQVKIGACEAHFHNLEKLHALVSESNVVDGESRGYWIINEDMIQQSKTL